jgi:cytochrome c oxidase subunit 3
MTVTLPPGARASRGAPMQRLSHGGRAGGPGDGEGGRGGGGDDWRGRPERPDRSRFALDRRELGFALFLVGIGTLFAAFLAAYVMLRRTVDPWPPAGAPAAPEGLWLSTALIAASSVPMARAVRAWRAGARGRLRRALALALGLGVAFVAAQAWLWRELFAAGLAISTNAYGMVFYALTGLHCLHLLGGLAWLAWLNAAAARARDPDAPLPRVDLAAVYWHFMASVWLVVFLVLYWFS